MTKILLKIRASLDMLCVVYEIKCSEEANCFHISVVRTLNLLSKICMLESFKHISCFFPISLATILCFRFPLPSIVSLMESECLKGLNSSGNDSSLQMWAGFKNSLVKTWKIRYKYVVIVFCFTPPSFPEKKNDF